MKSVQLQGYSHQAREPLLAALLLAVNQNDGCVVAQRSVSGSTVELRLEVQRYAVADFYAGMVGTGLELTRPTHQAMAGLCTCSQRSFDGREIAFPGVVGLSLNVCFLEGLTVGSYLLCSSTPA